MTQQDGYRLIARHAKHAGIRTKIGNHSLRGTGLTDYLKKRRAAGESARNGEPCRHTLSLHDALPIYTTAARTWPRWMNTERWGFDVCRTSQKSVARPGLEQGYRRCHSRRCSVSLGCNKGTSRNYLAIHCRFVPNSALGGCTVSHVNRSTWLLGSQGAFSITKCPSEHYA